jgi:formate-dependent nitrite reductase membrane component NrfD
VKVLCSSVLGIEALVVLLATSLATSNGSVANTTLAWIAGFTLMLLLILAIGTLRRPWGLSVGWAMQVLVLATSIVVGWTMLVVGLVFVALWFTAIWIGQRVETQRANEREAAGGSAAAE